MSTRAISARGSWLAAVPLELHGHRKKLDFFLRSLDAFRTRRDLTAADISVLEVGCSNGRNVSLPLAEQGYRVTGVDLHGPSIAYAQAQTGLANARFLCMDFFDFGSDDRFDVIVLSDILEHVTDPGRILAVALEHLAPAGMVLVCIPNGYGPYENEQRLLRATGLDRLLAAAIRSAKRLLGRRPERQTEYNYDSGHIQFFHLDDFRSLVASAGLCIDEQANGALFGGGVTYHLGLLLSFLVGPSLKLADRLPARWVSTWYFRLSAAAEVDLCAA